MSTHILPVVRVYDSHDEVYYVLRRLDGTPLAVPAWMTRPEAANAKIVPAARLPFLSLIELRRVALTCISSRVHNVHEENHDAAGQSKAPTTTLRGTARRSRHTTPTQRARAATPVSYTHLVSNRTTQRGVAVENISPNTFPGSRRYGSHAFGKRNEAISARAV